jgi:hypothetical protein
LDLVQCNTCHIPDLQMQIQGCGAAAAATAAAVDAAADLAEGLPQPGTAYQYYCPLLLLLRRRQRD